MKKFSSDKFSFIPTDKNNATIGLQIQKEGVSKIHIRDNPDNIRVLSVFVLLAIVSVGLFLLASSRAIFTYKESLDLSLFFTILFVLGAAKELKDMRPTYCIIDKQTGCFYYLRGGLFGSLYNSQNISGNISDILQLEMKRHSERGKDRFQIIFLLRNDTRLILSGRNLGFSECQDFSEAIRDFANPELQIKAVG